MKAVTMNDIDSRINVGGFLSIEPVLVKTLSLWDKSEQLQNARNLFDRAEANDLHWLKPKARKALEAAKDTEKLFEAGKRYLEEVREVRAMSIMAS